MPRYNSYKELANAFKSGELRSRIEDGKRVGYYIMLDKGGCQNSLNFYDPALSDMENESRQEGCREIFDAREGVEQLFDALEIPHEWC